MLENLASPGCPGRSAGWHPALRKKQKKARELGVDVFQSLISITQHTLNDSLVWRINYGPKDYVNRRGGDVLIEVDMHDATIKRVLRGQ